MPSGKDIVKVTDSFAVKMAVFCLPLLLNLLPHWQSGGCCLKAGIAGLVVEGKLCQSSEAVLSSGLQRE